MSDFQVNDIGGGVIRVQVGSNSELRDDYAEPAPQRATVHDGGFRADANGDVQQLATTRVHQDSIPENAGKGILATARNVHGGPALKLTPESVVRVGDMETSLAVAEMYGFVKRDASGNYVETTAEERAAREQAERADEAPQMAQEFFPKEAEQVLMHLAGDVPHEQLTTMLAETVIRAASTGALDVNVEEIVSRTGMSPERAEQFFGAAVGLFQDQADAALATMGIEDSTPFVQWAVANRSQEFRQAMVAQVTGRVLHPMRELAREFIRTVPASEEGLKAAGYEVRRDASTNELLVKVNGGWTSVRAAARRGWM